MLCSRRVLLSGYTTGLARVCGVLVEALFSVCRPGTTILRRYGVAPGMSCFQCALEIEDSCSHLTFMGDPWLSEILIVSWTNGAENLGSG